MNTNPDSFPVFLFNLTTVIFHRRRSDKGWRSGCPSRNILSHGEGDCLDHRRRRRDGYGDDHDAPQLSK